MKGVQRNSSNGKFAAIVTREYKLYRLGNFDTAEEAHVHYMKYKALIKAEKHGGAKVDLVNNTREKKRNPPSVDEVLPVYIVLTRNNIYKVFHNKKLIAGTFKTVDQAKAAYDMVKPSPPSNIDIVRAVEDACIKSGNKLNVQGTDDEPLFQANHIGKLLGLTNIHETVKGYNDDEKEMILTSTKYGQHKILFLNINGVEALDCPLSKTDGIGIIGNARNLQGQEKE